MNYKEILSLSKDLNQEICSMTINHNRDEKFCCKDLFDALITDSKLKNATHNLFYNGHYAQAIEMSYKYVNNLVKSIANEKKRDGADLMTYVFYENNPIIKLNELDNASERDEQKGFMFIFTGCMIGIRNPRAHEDEWIDTEETALYLISFANYLVTRLKNL